MNNSATCPFFGMWRFPRACVPQRRAQAVGVTLLSWAPSLCSQRTWALAKENEQWELSSEVAFQKVAFAMNRKSDKLGGKLPSA